MPSQKPHKKSHQDYIDEAKAAMAGLPESLENETTEEATVEYAAPAVKLIQAEKLRLVLAESARRRAEALVLHEGLPHQEAFYACKAKNRVVWGSNRGGKTLPAAVEVARAVTGQDPYDKYPKEGRAYIVGMREKELGEVIYRKLFRAGAFKMIRDEITGAWRTFRPWTDEHRVAEAKPAPPLIPPRLVDSISWMSKKDQIPNKVVMVNGWELDFYTSLGLPPQGMDLDLVWFDEEIVNRRWFPEMQARLVDRRGRFIWSATPQVGTDQLYDLHEDAEEHELDPDYRTKEFFCHIERNPYLTQQAKEDFRDTLSEDERDVRWDGNWVLTGFKIFPEWKEKVHCFDERCDPDGDIPASWTRYAVIDPGFQTCAVLFCAIPDPRDFDRNVVYDELYIRNCSADEFGRQMAQKAAGQIFQAFLIDHHGSRVRQAGTGLTIADHYRIALRDNKVKSVLTGHGFFPSNPDTKENVEAARKWLLPRQGKPPILLVSRKRCPNFRREIKRYPCQKDREGKPTDKPSHIGDVHLMDAFRYLAVFNPTFVRAAPSNESWAVNRLKAKRAKQQRREEDQYIRLG